MSSLAVSTGSVNLGQGFPDTDGPREVLDAAIAAINGGLNQYPPGPGMPVLRQAIAAHQQRFYGLQYDPDTEVLVTAGATEALAGSLHGLARHRRRGRAVRADVRQLPGVHRPRRSGCEAGHAATSVVRVRSRRAPRRDHTEDEAAAHQHAAQPDRACAERRRAAADRRPRHRARPDRHHRRGLRAPGVRRRTSTSRWRRCPACASARW